MRGSGGNLPPSPTPRTAQTLQQVPGVARGGPATTNPGMPLHCESKAATTPPASLVLSSRIQDSNPTIVLTVVASSSSSSSTSRVHHCSFQLIVPSFPTTNWSSGWCLESIKLIRNPLCCYPSTSLNSSHNFASVIGSDLTQIPFLLTKGIVPVSFLMTKVSLSPIMRLSTRVQED